MKLKNKIILVVVIILALSGAVIMGIWYQTSSKLTSTYLQNVSESSMKDAYHAFEYLLTDTSYMATMISENQKNVIQPVNTLNSEQIKQNNQWNQIYLENRRKILEYLNGIDCNLLEYLTQRDIQTKNSGVNVRYRGKHRFFKGFNEFIKEKTRRCDNDFEKIERHVFF